MWWLIGFSIALTIWYFGFSPYAKWKRNECHQAILQALRTLQPNGTGYTISVEVKRITGRSPSLASIYDLLSELEKKGEVSSRWGVATAERGWRRPRHYWITADHPELKHEAA